MSAFEHAVARRIAAVSAVLALLASPLAAWLEQERAEEAVVAFASEESRRLLTRLDVFGPQAHIDGARADAAAEAIAGGLFDIVELYDGEGTRVAEALTPEGAAVELALSRHLRPRHESAAYESATLADGRWALRVFVPLRAPTGPARIAGYLEGVRVIPDWQRRDMQRSALLAGVAVAFAALLCGAVLYPVVVRLARENARNAHTREVLLNILPEEVADELVRTGQVRPVRYEGASILFTDFAGFTQAVGAMPAARMIAELNDIFAAFDTITAECGVERIKTIGDAYMAAAGIAGSCPDHAARCVRAGLRMIDYLAQRNAVSPFKWALRVGVHSGPVVAGVIGTRKYAYDVWGDTVNIASRMESCGEPGRVNISAYTYDLVQEAFDCSYRGKIDAKGKGRLDMYFVNGEQANGQRGKAT